jgi:hypothetical protein
MLLESLTDKIIEEVSKEDRFLGMVVDQTPLDFVKSKYGGLIEIEDNILNMIIGRWKVHLDSKYARIAKDELEITDPDPDTTKAFLKLTLAEPFAGVNKDFREIFINALLLGNGNTVYLYPKTSDIAIGDEPDITMYLPDYVVEIYLADGSDEGGIYTVDSSGNARQLDYYTFKRIINMEMDRTEWTSTFGYFMKDLEKFTKKHGISIPRELVLTK